MAHKIIPGAFQAYATRMEHTFYSLDVWIVSSFLEENNLKLRGTEEIDVYQLRIDDMKVPRCPPHCMVLCGPIIFEHL